MNIYDMLINRAFNKNGEGGGGGGGDLSTAQVTIISNEGYAEMLPMLQIDEDGLWVFPSPDAGVYTVPLINGAFNTYYSGAGQISATGDATISDHNDITVTGDCTITVS